MKSVTAKANELSALEDLGRATLEVVHGLKNRLNGVKLYATFLRKRLEREDRSAEERETLAKVITGIDRAAQDLTALVRYAQPVELRRQARVDLRKIVITVAQEVSSQRTIDLSGNEIEDGSLRGEFDPAVLSEAIKAITEQAVPSGSAQSTRSLSISVQGVGGEISPEALIEWRGVKSGLDNRSSHQLGNGNISAALATKIIEAHGGRLEYHADTIRAWLPLSE